MTILKHVPRIIPPRLLYVLAQMGHGDEIVLADANFPAASTAALSSFTSKVSTVAAQSPKSAPAMPSRRGCPFGKRSSWQAGGIFVTAASLLLIFSSRSRCASLTRTIILNFLSRYLTENPRRSDAAHPRQGRRAVPRPALHRVKMPAATTMAAPRATLGATVSPKIATPIIDAKTSCR